MLTTGLLCMQQTLDCQEREENREYLNEPRRQALLNCLVSIILVFILQHLARGCNKTPWVPSQNV